VHADAKATRAYMPEEYVFIGRSIAPSDSVSRSAKSMIAFSFSRIWSLDQPWASPPRTMFSRPVRFWLKPTPSASSVETRPRTSTRPCVGGRIPESARSRVDLPAPLWPMTPSTVPCGTSKETPLTALMTFCSTFWRLALRISAAFRVGLASALVR